MEAEKNRLVARWASAVTLTSAIEKYLVLFLVDCVNPNSSLACSAPAFANSTLSLLVPGIVLEICGSCGLYIATGKGKIKKEPEISLVLSAAWLVTVLLMVIVEITYGILNGSWTAWIPALFFTVRGLHMVWLAKPFIQRLRHGTADTDGTMLSDQNDLVRKAEIVRLVSVFEMIFGFDILFSIFMTLFMTNDLSSFNPVRPVLYAAIIAILEIKFGIGLWLSVHPNRLIKDPRQSMSLIVMWLIKSLMFATVEGIMANVWSWPILTFLMALTIPRIWIVLFFMIPLRKTVNTEQQPHVRLVEDVVVIVADGNQVVQAA